MRSPVKPLRAASLCVLALAGVVVVAVGVGCPPSVQCSSQNDCPIGKACNKNQQCVDELPPPPPHDAGVPAGEGEGEGGGVGEGEGQAGGEGEGETNTNATVQLNAPATMFVPDPANANNALVGIQTANGNGLDEELTFDPVQGTVGNTPVFDFAAKAVAPCGIDTVFTLKSAIAGTLPGQHGQETWFSCGHPPHVFIEYDQDTGNLFKNTGVQSAEVTRLLGPYVHDALSATKKARIVTAARGGGLQIIATDTTNDSLATPRQDSVTPTFTDGTTLTKVEQIFVLSFDDNIFGDVLLVFDRGTTPKLVPIQREQNQDAWHGVPIQNAPLLKNITLPADVTAVIFREDQFQTANLSSLNTDQTTQNITNLISIRPTKQDGNFGEVDFDRYEVVVQQPTPTIATSGFQPLHLQAADAPAVPSTSDRTLLQLVNSGQDVLVYYALTSSPHVWRFPLHRNQTDQRDADVARAGNGFLVTGRDKPNGMVLVPGNQDEVWLSFANQERALELDRVFFQAAF